MKLGRPRVKVLKSKYSRNVYGLGHTKKGGNGYMVKVVGRDHPRANVKGEVYEHLLVAEHALGRPLSPKNCVHHVNENRADNRSSNLVICENLSYHFLLHSRLRAYRATGNPNSRKCGLCGKWVIPNEPDSKFVQRKYKKGIYTANYIDGYHRTCKQKADKRYYNTVRKVEHD